MLLVMAKGNWNSAIGLKGVAEDEDPRARRWGELFEAPMILLAVWIVIEWYLEAKGLVAPHWVRVTDWIIWLFFILETTVLSSLVRDRWRYLRSNWLNLFIIVMGIPILWGGETYVGALRGLRLLLILPLVLNMSRTVRLILSRNHLGVTLVVSGLIIGMAGLLIAGIDPSIESVGDGIWWAWVTVSTVGYGDVVPETPAGRLFGGILILFGVGLFSLLTANFSAFFVARQEKEILEEEEDALAKLNRMERQLARLEEKLGRIERKLERDEGP